MAKSCRLSPVVKRRNGTRIEEKDSKLFKDIKKAVNDNDTAWKMWAYTKTPEFRQQYKNDVDYDELGEVTFPSLIKVLGLEDTYNNQKRADEAARDYGFTDTIFENPDTAVQKINDFNSKEQRFIASLQKEDNGYRAVVTPRNAQSIDKARQQSYNHALTGEIIDIMRKMGFSVEWVANPRYDGLFNPQNATLYDGLLNIISIARGERGEDALPEEFSHLMIEGLINHPLVQRLLNTLTDEQIQEILGDSYEKYYETYNGDNLKLKKEAAGKLLAQQITGQGTISQPIIEPKRPLLQRIWNWIKNLFSKVRNEDLAHARINAHEAVAGIYNMIASGEAVPLVDKRSILSGDQLYKLKEEFNDLEKVSAAGEHIVARMLKNERAKGNKEREKKVSKTLQRIKDFNEGDKPFEGIQAFLGDAIRQIEIISTDMRRAQKNEDSNQLTEIKLINEVAKVAREIDTFVDGYEEVIRAIATFDDEDNIKELGLPNEESGQALANMANDCLKALNKMTEWRQATSRNILYNASRTIYKEDKVRGIGTRKEEVMSMTEILDHASRDINFVDRWLSAMSDADDALLTIFDSIVKNQQYERDMEMIEWNAQIAAIDEKLRKAGYSSDFMYERDKDGAPTGRIISPYDWDTYNQELKKQIAFLREQQEKLGWTPAQYSKRLNQWKNGADKNHNSRLIKVFVDPEIDTLYREKGEKAVPDDAVYEMVPNPKVYSRYADRINNLAPAQKEYYNEMMTIKREMMTKIPHRGQGIYKTINISKDFVEGIISNSTGNPIRATLDNYKKKFFRRPDDIGFGTGENYKEDVRNILSNEKDSYQAAEQIIRYLADAVDEDIIAVVHPRKLKKIIDKNKDDIKKATEEVLEAIASENFAIVDTDFANHRVQRLPIYYTRPLRDKKMLSTDFSGSMVAYSAMAVNYEKMNEVVDILEVGRSYVKERAVLENEGNSPIMSRFNALGKVYKAYVERAGSGTNIAGRLDDYMDSVVYEERKNDEGSFEILRINLDTTKTLDAIKDYTGLIMLGFNIFSTLSNIGMGKLQQWIEAAGGEYFTFKDYAKAVTQYSALMPGCLAEMASPVKKNKLSLLIQMFDPMGDYYENLRDPNFQKSKVARILGNGIMAYIGMNAGEHLLHCQTMLAILNNTKLINVETKEKISLYDALEVKETDGVYRLVLKPNLAYERELIDNTGNPKSNKNYGKPVRDEEGKIKTELVQISSADPLLNAADNRARQKQNTSIFKDFSNFIFKKKKVVRKVNDSLNGAFSANDKGAIHKKAIGRLVMQFRQWMPAHYMRRFARAHYDADLEQWREGYYTTVVKTLNQMRKEYKRAGIQVLKLGSTLSEHEKANLRRANAELAQFWMLMFLVRLGGRVKDRDRSWLDKMALYQIHRMNLEVGGSMPVNGDFFSNIFQILQSPAASINTFQRFSKMIQFWNMFDEIQTGRYQGWSEWQRDVYQGIPALGQITKAVDFDDSMFVMFEKD